MLTYNAVSHTLLSVTVFFLYNVCLFSQKVSKITQKCFSDTKNVCKISKHRMICVTNYSLWFCQNLMDFTLSQN